MIKTILKYITALWLMFFVGMWSSGSVLAKQQDVRIISMNDNEIILELTLPQFEMETVQGPDGMYQKVLLRGWAKTSRVGYPELPLNAVLLQVPEEGAIDVRVLEGVHETIQDCRIYPVPRLGLSDRGEPTTEFVKDADAYNASGFFPKESATIGARSVLRGMSTARLEIYPFQWNAMTKELRYYKKIRIIVQFENPSTQSTINNQQSTIKNAAFEKLKQGAIINYKKGPQDANPQLSIVNRQSSIVNIQSSPPSTSLRMEVLEDGIYRLTYEDLIGAGLPTGIDAGTLQLFNLGNEAAIKEVSAGSYFSPGDYVEFHAQAVDNQYTGTNVYWLYWGQGTGKRMGETDGNVTGGGTRPGTFANTIHAEENHTWWEGMPGAPDEDYWFWERFNAPKSADYAFDIPSPDTAAEATVKVCFRGRSTAMPHPNHHTLIYLNGTSIGDALWDGNNEFVQEITVPPGVLLDGTNTLTVDCPGDTGAIVDIVYFNWIEVEYARYFEAVDDELKFTVTGDGRLEIEIQDLGGPGIRLFDITDPNEVKEVVNISIEPNGPAYKAIFEDQVVGAKTYYLLTDGRIRQPESPALWSSANLESPANGADWIVITARDFLASVEPLRLLRENQGLRVKVVSIEDIYNEFNYGLIDPKAVKGFLQCAYENWEQPAPTYVFLIGDANADFRDYWGSGKQNIVPPHLCHTDLGVTPEDNWYVCMDGPDDVLPDMFIGRIPASSAEMAAVGINKIIGFENSTWLALEKKVLLAADNNEMTFEDLNEDLVPYLPSEFGVDKVYLRLYPNVEDATQDIISSIDQGMMVTNYVGHGSVTNWTGEYMFDSGDVPALTNPDRLSFVIAMTCLNGYFSQPFHYCLAEEFVAAEGKGAIGAFAPSGLGYVWEHEVLDPELFSILFDQGNSILGPLTTEAKISAYAQGVTEDTVKTFTLFGDPATYCVQKDDPLVVELVSFTAEGLKDHVLLEWETASEINNAGFYLWRSETEDAEYNRITDCPIPAEGGLTQGAKYSYEDFAVVPGLTYYYKLENIDYDGVSAFHGPVSVTMGNEDIGLIYPKDGALVPVYSPPTFEWESADLVRFKLAFSRSPDFTGKVIMLPRGCKRHGRWITGESYTPNRRKWRKIERLGRRGGTVYWRVYGEDEAGKGFVSKTFQLNIEKIEQSDSINQQSTIQNLAMANPKATGMQELPIYIDLYLESYGNIRYSR